MTRLIASRAAAHSRR